MKGPYLNLRGVAAAALLLAAMLGGGAQAQKSDGVLGFIIATAGEHVDPRGSDELRLDPADMWSSIDRGQMRSAKLFSVLRNLRIPNHKKNPATQALAAKP